MAKNTINSAIESENGCYIPDFCRGETVFRLILVLELIAIVFALAGYHPQRSIILDIAQLSMFIQWIGLASAGLLCLLRKQDWLKGDWVVTVSSLLVTVLMTVVMSVVAYRANQWVDLDLFESSDLGGVVFRHVAIALVIQGLALRYFYVQHASRNMLMTESRARLQALQARIRPHFLFNSLNTIASLTHDQPDRAERAIESLAELFRASLKADSSISLQQEIDFTREYIELEKLRLDDRLRIVWQIDAELHNIMLPALTLQPLVENAIYHGIEPMPGGGEVTISIQQQQALTISISNPLSEKKLQQHSKGNKMALENIRERLDLAFQGQAKIEHIVENDLYKVVIRVPQKVVAGRNDPVAFNHQNKSRNHENTDSG